MSRRHLKPFIPYNYHKYIASWHHDVITDQLERVERGELRRLMLFLPPRHGKQIAHSTPILTPNGWTTHGALRVGDKVFSPSGEQIKIIGLSDEDEDDYVVDFGDEKIRCHGNHEWTVFDRPYQKYKTHETKWFLNDTKHGNQRKLTSGNRYQYQVQNINALEYSIKELPIDPYFLGVWLGDGKRTDTTICYHPDDYQPINEIQRRGFNITWSNTHKDTGVKYIGFGYQNIIQILRNIGVSPDKYIPEIYLRSHIDQRLDLLAGLIDTDGHVERTTGRVRIATCDVRLKNSIIDLCTGLGFQPYVFEQEPCLSTSGIQGKKVVYYIGFQPTMDIPTKIPRKRIERLALQRRRSIKNITFMPNGEKGRCIQVDSPDGLYLVGKTLIPTHNSEIGSIQFPAWFLGKNPDKEIICCSYTSDLAIDFGRKTRNLIDSIEYQRIFDLKLAADSKAANKWRTDKGGSYTAVGVGGPITGRGADILIIDDPFKNRKEAESPLIRQQVWDWYLSTAYTRLSPNGAVIVIQCITGDTKVSMANAPDKDLRDIKVGDKILTYDNGKLSTSIVKNHTSQGSDCCFTIRMKSGKIIKANERHPFLINYNNKLQWTRVKNLVTGQRIVTLRDRNINGEVKRVSGKDVKNQQNVRAIVYHTTEKRSGLMGIALRLLTQNQFVIDISNIVMGLLLKILTNFWRSKMGSALFANYHLEKMFVPIGVENSVSTISMVQKKSEDSSVMTVILLWVMRRLIRLPFMWQSISDFTLDEIVSIEDSGEEEVFDIEVDRTANFIANGVVSSNTRWHMDDLSGRLIDKAKVDGDKWKIIKFPAIAIHDETINGKFLRKSGDALWPTRFSLEKLEQIKKVLGNYDWAALYQQEPVDEDSIEFKRTWFKYRSEEQVQKLNTRRFLTVDTAGRMTTKSDYFGFSDNRVDRERNWNIKSWKAKMNSAELLETLFTLQDLHHYEKIGIEKTIYVDAFKPFLEIEMQKRKKVLPIFELEHKGISKELRIRELVPRYQAGSIYHISGYSIDLEKQLLHFPKGTEDDIIDSLAYQNQVADAPFFSSSEEIISENNNFDKFSPISSF